MRKFSRCILILIVVSLIAGIAGYFYEKKEILPVYTSTTQLYVVPGEENEASVRAANGGLNNDFMIIFTSNVVISDAQKTAGTSEDIAKYLKVSSPANSNIVEITCENVDQNTAKLYVDAVAKTAIRTTSIIPVKSIQILSEGTMTNEPIRPDLYKNTGIIAGIAAVICLIIEILVLLIMSAFKKPVDNSDDEWDYERHYGKYANNQVPLLSDSNINSTTDKNFEEKTELQNSQINTKDDDTYKSKYSDEFDDEADILENLEKKYGDEDIPDGLEEALNQSNNEILKNVFEDVAASIEKDKKHATESENKESKENTNALVESENEENEIDALAEGESEEAEEDALAEGESEEVEEDALAEGESEEAEEDALAEGESEEAEEDALAEGESEEAEEDALAEGESEEAEEDALTEGESEEIEGDALAGIESEETKEDILAEVKAEKTECEVSSKETNDKKDSGIVVLGRIHK